MKLQPLKFLKKCMRFLKRPIENKGILNFSEFLDVLEDFEAAGHLISLRTYRCKKCGLSFEEYRDRIRSKGEPV
jgi:predicted Zn-ribbon and HTH transcriptional regulator